jgi:tRNA1Val (adenine37-N6)-methyltransferase
MEAERIDDIGFGGIRLIQRPDDFCFGIDAVLLADFVKTRSKAQVIDLGTGTGVIPLIVSHKTDTKKIVGVEIQPEIAALAARNVLLNDLSHRISIIQADVADIIPLVGKCSFDTVISNPPYMGKHAGVKNQGESRRISRHETTADLDTFIRIASELLRDKGDFFLVHRPARLVDIIASSRKHGLEPKKIRFVHPNKNSKANILLLQCVKNGKPELRFEAPLYVYKADGSYTKELLKIYEKI